MPDSFAAMMGGKLSLIGTSTNLLASDVYDRMGAEFEAISMFEFTQLGIVVLLVGIVYLMTVGQRLVPERLSHVDDLTSTYELSEYFTEVVVREGSAFVGRTVRENFETLGIDVDVIQLVRDGVAVTGLVMNRTGRAGDIVDLRTDRESILSLIEDEELDLAPDSGGFTDERLR